MLRRNASSLAVGLVVSVSLLLVASFVAAQSQQVWAGSAAFSSGTLAGTTVSSTGQLVLSAHAGGWTKYAGNPVLSPSSGWASSWTITPDVLYENGVYKMWYAGCTTSACAIGYATSSDGIAWTAYSGNPVLTGNSSSWDTSIAGPRVIHDGTVYRMWYAGNGPNGIRIAYATSPDGITWTKYSPWPVFNGTMSWDTSAVNLPAVEKVGSTFVMYFSGSTGSSYSMGRATSPDGVHWTEYSGNPVLVAQGGWEGDRVHPSWFSVGSSGYDLYYTGGTVGTPAQIGHATSLDGLTWIEDPANPVLGPDAAASWDPWAVAHPYLISAGTETRLYFTGYSDSSNTVLQIGYATLSALSISYASQGTWASAVFDSGSPSTTWTSLSWTASTPASTAVGVSLQVGNTSVPDFTWTLSQPALTTPAALHVPEARYARAIVALVTLNSSQTPILSSVSVTYEIPSTTSGPYGGLGLVGLAAIAALLIGLAAALVIIALWARRTGLTPPPPPGAPPGAAGTFCAHCGASVPFGNRFCGRCGQPVTAPGGGPPPP